MSQRCGEPGVGLSNRHMSSIRCARPGRCLEARRRRECRHSVGIKKAGNSGSQGMAMFESWVSDDVVGCDVVSRDDCPFLADKEDDAYEAGCSKRKTYSS